MWLWILKLFIRPPEVEVSLARVPQSRVATVAVVRSPVISNSPFGYSVSALSLLSHVQSDEKDTPVTQLHPVVRYHGSS